ncbi:MAG: hypothetical protein Fur0024_5580 [Patescibacteria group bacterium]
MKGLKEKFSGAKQSVLGAFNSNVENMKKGWEYMKEDFLKLAKEDKEKFVKFAKNAL